MDKLSCYQWESFVPACCPCSTHLPCFWQGQSLICCMWACLCLLLLFFILHQHRVLFVLVVCAAPFPPLSKPLRVAPSLFSTIPWVQVAEPKLSPAACVSGGEGGVAFWGGGEGGGVLKPPGHWRMIRMDPLQAQSECRLNVLLLYLQQPLSYSPPQT